VLDLALLNPERGVDRLGLLGEEDPAAVADQRLGGAEALERVVQDHQIGRQILPRAPERRRVTRSASRSSSSGAISRKSTGSSVALRA